MTPAVTEAYRRAAALIRAEAEAIRVDLYASDEECDRLAREKGRLHMLAKRIEREGAND
jgi:hypothetical protein